MWVGGRMWVCVCVEGGATQTEQDHQEELVKHEAALFREHAPMAAQQPARSTQLPPSLALEHVWLSAFSWRPGLVTASLA